MRNGEIIGHHPLIRGLLLPAFLWLLTACGMPRDTADVMEDYSDRIARVLEVERAPLKTVDYRFPTRRDRQIEIPRTTINVLDFLALFGCDLQVKIGERNSVLGKVMDATQQLQYESELLAELQRCATESEADKELQEELKRLLAIKQQQFPAVIWNGIWASKEIEHLFSGAHGALPVGEEDMPVYGLSAATQVVLLESLQAAKADGNAIDTAVFNEALKSWRANEVLGQAIVGALIMEQGLREVMSMLAQQQDGVCPGGRETEQARILRNVLFKVYGERVQAHMSQLWQIRRQLLPGFRQLAQISGAMPASMQRFHERYLSDTAKNSVWVALDQAVKAHQQRWQSLLESCGVVLGK